MSLPHTYFSILLLMALSALCWGSWAGALKMAPKWRFELFAVDLALGFMAASLLCAVVFGNMGYDGFSLVDDAMHAGKQQWVMAAGGGMVFALSNMFLLASVSIGGMAVAFTISFGTALIVQAFVNYFGVSARTGNITIPISGAILVLGAILFASMIHASLTRQRHEEIAKAGKAKSTRRPSSAKSMWLAIISGLLMAAWHPLVYRGMVGEVGMGPYATAALMALGALLGTAAFAIFFIYLPVEGEPLEVSSVLGGTRRQHLLGLLGGAVLAVGVSARLVGVAANTDPGVSGGLLAGMTPVAPLLACILGFAAPVIAALLGFAVWKELKDDARGPALWMGAAMPLLFLGGVILISMGATNPIVP